MRAMGDANLNRVTAIGRTRPDTRSEIPSALVATKVAGRDANDERVPKPTICTGATAFANCRIVTRPKIAVVGYNNSVTTTSRPQAIMMNVPSTLSTVMPSVAANGNTSANIPIGANNMTQRINTNIALFTALKKSTKSCL